MTTRLMPPGDGLHNTIIVNGRTYTQTPGNTLDVPDFDAVIMTANGWLPAERDATVGTTAQRPANPTHGQTFIDTTASALITYDAKGKTWRHHLTGASA